MRRLGRILLGVGLSVGPVALLAPAAMAADYSAQAVTAASQAEQIYDVETGIARIEAAAQEANAAGAVQAASEEVMALIGASRGYAKTSPERFHAEVERLLRPVIDFPRFARSVMGVWYKRATPAQRTEFAESFKWTLVRTYASALTEFHDGQVRILPQRRKAKDPNKATVSMEITYQGTPYMVVYAMQRRAELWQLVNVVIEGINLRLNYRSQFDTAMKAPEHGRDLDKVIAAWTRSIQQQGSAQTSAAQTGEST